MSRKPVFAGIGLLLVLSSAFAFIYWNQARKAEETAQYAAFLEQGTALFGQKKFSEALLELEKIPESSITDWRVPYYRGSALIKLKDYPAAALSLEQSLALDSKQAGTLYALGVAYYKLGNLKLSRGYFEAVLKINPNDAHAKGLIDIMANLEKQSEPTASTTEPEPTDAQ